jgi:enhancing lycopene biosynthesis protein 2
MRVAVLLNGSGHRDGSEIHEAVLSMLALEKHGADISCFALNEPQARVCDHVSGQVANETRNMLTESARIARGKIKPLSEFVAKDFAALMIPGGTGVAFNLCDFATAGRDMQVHPMVADAIRSAFDHQLKIGAVCIAPVLLAKVLGEYHPQLTVGALGDVSQVLESWGAVMVDTSKGGAVIDTKHRLATTPAYMYDDSSMQAVWEGVEKVAAYLCA